MKGIRQYDVWLADLNPRYGTEPGEGRPVVIIQTDLLNVEHPSTIVCPSTTNIHRGADTLRIFCKRGTASLASDSEFITDQMRAIDNDRFVKRLGSLPANIIQQLKNAILIVLDLD